MTIKINKKLCNGCGNCQQSKCSKICPCDLLYKGEDNKAKIRDKADCWDCAACVKKCPRGAIELYLQPEVGGRGSTLIATNLDGKIVWKLKRKDGEIKEFEIKNKLYFNRNL